MGWSFFSSHSIGNSSKTRSASRRITTWNPAIEAPNIRGWSFVCRPVTVTPLALFWLDAFEQCPFINSPTKLAAGRNSSRGCLELRLLDFTLLFGGSRFEFLMNFQLNERRRKINPSAFLVRGVMRISWWKSARRWAGLKSGFPPLFSSYYVLSIASLNPGNC